MKKFPLTLLVACAFALNNADAQVADSTIQVDTMAIDTPPPPPPPSRGSASGESSEGGAQQTEYEEGLETNDPFALLRKEREERERIESNLEDIVAYPLNLETDNLNSFQVLDSIADNNRFIFTGEDHRVEKFNTTLEMKMMQYLSGRGYRYYIMEAGWTSAWMVNRYIIDGDSLAEQILSTYYSKNFFAMFTGMKEINDTIKSGQKITAVGLDIERDAPLALRTLLYLLPEKEAPDSLEMFVESLKILSNIHIQQAMEYAKNADNSEGMFDFGGYEEEWDFDYDEEEEAPKYFYFNMIKTIQDLTRRFREKEGEFKAYLGPNFPDFARTIKEMENWLIWIGYEKEELPQSWVYREQYMEGNFRMMFKDKPEAKGFGQFGRCHINRVTKVGDCGFAFFSSLNKRIITKMPELENKLASIGIFYGGLDNHNKVGDNGNVDDLIKLTDKGSANLFMDLNDYGDEMLRSKFSSVIIVKSTNYREHPKKKKTTTDWDYDYDDNDDFGDDFSFSLDFNMIQRDYDFNSFNNMSSFGLNKPLMNYEFGMTFTVDRVVGNTAFGFFPQVQMNLGDTLKQTMKGWNFRYIWGKDLVKAKWLEVTPELGIGYIKMKYVEERTNSESTTFGTPYKTEFYNPAFLFDARLNVGVIIGIFEVRGFAGYNLDVSNPSWRLTKNIVVNGPETKFSGLYTGFGASLRFGGF